MMRLVIDIYGEDTQGTKEAVAMLLEPLGRVRVVSVITDGKEEKRRLYLRSPIRQQSAVKRRGTSGLA